MEPSWQKGETKAGPQEKSFKYNKVKLRRLEKEAQDRHMCEPFINDLCSSRHMNASVYERVIKSHV